MINGVPQLEDLGDVAGKRVLVRCDFNVPIRDGVITDDLRIRAALPTLAWLQERGATVTACSHLGRPKGAPDPAFSMDPVRAALAELAPGVELLEYLAPRDGRPAPADLKANDLQHWQTVLAATSAAASFAAVRDAFGLFVSPGAIELAGRELGFGRAALLRDPDGHGVELIER